MTTPRVIRVTGALVEATPLPDAALYEVVHVGPRRLLGEVIQVRGEVATIQVFEDTAGLALESEVVPSGTSLRAKLGPGLLGAVLDGIGRPLEQIAVRDGSFLAPGTMAPMLDEAKPWRFTPSRTAGDSVQGGDVLGHVEERGGLVLPILVPPTIAGTLTRLEAGEFTILDEIGTLDDGTSLHLAHDWPVRVPRPVASWLPATRPFVTNQRVFDFLFPVAEGGAVAVPGGFGTGKTVIEQSLARHAEADVVVYIGCGERGNEMAEVLEEFPELEDPRSGRPLMDRTVLVVNTSNMPVAAREASVYLGLTIAEYFRDLGLRVALMADSLSRWAEALREIGSLLREMPGEEGYPTSLGNRLGKLAERAGRVHALGRPERDGAVTMITALSPPGGDFAEPVTQAAVRVAGALWALDPALAQQRQFPAVDWETSYSLQAEAVRDDFETLGGPGWGELREWALTLLQRDRELRDVAALVGPDALEDRDRLLLEVARWVRDLLIGQSAYDPADMSSPPPKTWAIATLLREAHQRAEGCIGQGGTVAAMDLVAVRRAIAEVRAAVGDGVTQAADQARTVFGRTLVMVPEAAR
jgi:V/A-type H+-transporting ATPase subunit A